MPSTYRLGEHEEGATTVLDLAGEIDLAAVPPIRSRLGQLVDAGVRSVMIDLTGVTFMDSAGIAVLIAGRRLLHDVRGRFHIRNARHKVSQVLNVTGVYEALALPEALARPSDLAATNRL